MSVYSISRRYSKSIVDLAREKNQLSAIVDNASTILDSLNSRELTLLLKSPIIKADKKTSILSTIYDGKISDMMMNFIAQLTKKGREGLLKEICENILQRHDEINKVKVAQVTTAVEMKEDVLKDILNQLNDQKYSFKIQSNVDPSILGGFILKIEDKIYDASVRSQISKLKKQLINQ